MKSQIKVQYMTNQDGEETAMIVPSDEVQSLIEDS